MLPDVSSKIYGSVDICILWYVPIFGKGIMIIAASKLHMEWGFVGSKRTKIKFAQQF
jgi:hypothetical protein